MSINRFRNVIPVRSNYIPQTYIPDFGAIASVLGKQQQEYDTALAVGEKVPEHLQIEQERNALNNYMSGVRGKIDSLAQIYSEQGVTAGDRERRKLLREVGRDWQPGGKADRFQKRLASYQSAVKEIEERYKNDPKVAEFYKNQIKVSDFDDYSGKNYGISSPSMSKIYSTEELGDYYDKVLGNISADQIVKGSYLDKKTLAGISFKDLLRSGKTKFIDWNKAAGVLANSTTPEIQLSERVKGQAYGLKGDQGQFIQTDSSGNPILDQNNNIQFANTSLGSLLQGYATGKAFTEEDESNKIVSNTFAEWLAKDRTTRKRDMEQMAVLTQPFNRNKGIFANNVAIKDGKLELKGSKAKKYSGKRAMIDAVTTDIQKRGFSQAALGTYIVGNVKTFFEQAFDSNDKIKLDSPEISNTVKVLESRGAFKNEDGSDMNEEQRLNALGNYLNYHLENLSVQATTTPILDKKYQDNWNQILFQEMDNAESNTPGLLSNVKVYDKKGKVMTGTEFMKNKVDEENMPNIETEVTNPQSMLPYGTRTFQVGDEEYRVEPLMSDKQTPQYGLNMAYRASNGVLNNFSVEEELPPMSPIFTDKEGNTHTNPLSEYINVRGNYKMEYTPEGYNLYRKDGGKYFKLNEIPLDIR